MSTTPRVFGSREDRRASFACCIGQFARSQLMKLSPHSEWAKFEIGPLGVDPQLFAPRPFRSSPRTFEILCVGGWVRDKGQYVLVAAVNRLAKSISNLRLRLVGDGPDREGLARAIEAAASLTWWFLKVALPGSYPRPLSPSRYLRVGKFRRRNPGCPDGSHGDGNTMRQHVCGGNTRANPEQIDGNIVPLSDDRECPGAISDINLMILSYAVVSARQAAGGVG